METAAQATALHYEQRRPETTPLYRLVASHLETFLAEARAAHERGVPRYVERELSAVGRIFVREVWRWQREQFGASLVHARNAEASRMPNIRGGAVCFPQLFDADDAEPAQHDAERQRDVLEACLRGSLGIGELSSLPGSESAAGQETDEDSPGLTPRSLTGALASRRARSSRGFDIHAGVSVSPHDREGRERLLRYCARPPLSLERLSVLADGRVAYRIKKPRGCQTHRVMSPTQFLARLCALIPPPRHPLVRFHGVFAPHSSWRRHVVALDFSQAINGRLGARLRGKGHSPSVHSWLPSRSSLAEAPVASQGRADECVASTQKC